MSKRKKTPSEKRDREQKKQVRERMRQTGEKYQLALRRLTDEPTSSVLVQATAELPTIDAMLERNRVARAGLPMTRREYALDVTPREAEFGFAKRIVMTPMRLHGESDRMHAVAAELLGVSGHMFVVKLSAGGYEVRSPDMSTPYDAVSSFESVVDKYGSQRRIPFDPMALPTGIETPNTALPQARLGRAILERFRLRELSGAVRAAEPERKLVHFGSLRFEVIHPGARYARFSVEYVDLLKEDKSIPDGLLRGEVALGSIDGDDRAIADGLELVEIRVVDLNGEELDMARERRILREQAAWKRMFDEPGARPDIAAPDELPMDLEDLAERHRTLQPAHTLLVKRGDREFGAYHGPIIVYDMQVVAKCREGYRTLTTAELDRMYPDPALNVEEFNA